MSATVPALGSLEAAALDYAARGWPVVPLHSVTPSGACTCGSRDCGSPGKHPRTPNGLKDATTDATTIAAWWSRSPDANVGVVTGAISGLVVLDVDPRHGGDESLLELERRFGKLPDTVEVITGGSGRHFYFRHPGGARIRNATALAGLAGLDLKGDDGYVVAPPSAHASGRRYEWESSSHPDDVAIAPFPAAIITALRPPDAQRRADAPDGARAIPEGQRNDALTSLAGTMRRPGFGEDAIAAALLEHNRSHCTPPLAEDEVRAIAASIAKRPAAEGPSAFSAVPAESFRLAPLEDFAAVEEPGAGALVGADGDALIPEGSDVLIYGTGGAGKTTLTLDLGFHLAAGAAWLGMRVARPVRVLLVEAEGPRALFRTKVSRKLAAWGGAALDGRVEVLEHPWAAFLMSDAAHREWLAGAIREHEIDVVIAGPVTAIGMTEAGTIPEVRAFMALLNEVRAQAGRIVTFVLVHHENKAGTISGAWEGVGDTLLHVLGQGQGSTRLHVQKSRFSTTHHGATLQLAWTEEGEGFRVVEQVERTDDDIESELLAAVLASGGRAWSAVEEGVKGKAGRKREIRDRLVAERRLLAQTHGKRIGLWHPDDPALPAAMRPGGDA